MQVFSKAYVKNPVTVFWNLVVFGVKHFELHVIADACIAEFIKKFFYSLCITRCKHS